MIDTYSVLLATLVKDFHLEVLYASTDYDAIRLTVEDVARPGLQLAGYFDHFEPIDPELVARDSLLREFIGGGSYKYH